jgi:hypothetical protein
LSRRAKILLVLALVVVLGVIFLWPHGGYRRELEAYKKQLIAKGEKLTMAELAPPPSINPSNGARALMDLIATYRAPNDYPTNMIHVAPGLYEVGYTNGDANLTSNYAANCRKMAELRKVLTAPVIEFNLDYSQGMEILLPHLARLKSVEQLATITTMQALHTNDFAEAQSDLLSAVKLVSLYKNEPIMISGLVRIVMAQIAFSATWAALQSEAWTDPQLAELANEWQRMDLFSTAPASLDMERAVEIEELAKMREDRKLYKSVIDTSLLINGPVNPSAPSPTAGVVDQIKETFAGIPARLRFWRWRSHVSYQEERQLLRTYEAALESTHGIIDSGAFVPAWQEFSQQVSNINQSFPDRTNNVLFGNDTGGNFSLENYLRKLAISETGRRICVTAIALKRYHLHYGVYPTTLNNLVPEFLSAVPIDFMDGKPLRYKLRPDGDFLLYSVGEDGIDDGGDPLPLPLSLSKRWVEGRDIVWPRVATPAALEEYREKYGPATNAP